jgi:hydroxymethylbilane synthase
MAPEKIRIGTRGSELALWQARWVEAELRRIHPGLAVSVTVIKTTGDRVLDTPLASIGDKGLFTREIEHALLDRSVDVAVHSLKDLPTRLPAGLMLGAVCMREDVRDVFIPHPANPVRTLLAQPPGAHVATGSLRRKCQLLALRPDLVIEDIRGNLNTRMQKLDASTWAGMILAHAGVKRLGWEGRIGETLDALTVLPAVGQGALGIEIRADDRQTSACIAPLHHRATAVAALAERALLRRLEGGCQVPIGAFGRLEKAGADGERLVLDALVGSIDGRTVVRGKKTGLPDDAERIGEELGEELLERGAGTILASIRTGPGAPEPGVEM